MKFVIAPLVMLLALSGCKNTPIDANPATLAALAPDVPQLSHETQDAAVKEIIGGQCESLATIADACLITRDEARLLRPTK